MQSHISAVQRSCAQMKAHLSLYKIADSAHLGEATLPILLAGLVSLSSACAGVAFCYMTRNM